MTFSCYRRLPLLRTIRARNLFVRALGAIHERYKFLLVGYVVMPDHVHFILWLDGTRDNAPLLGHIVGAYKSLTTVQWLNYLKAKEMVWPGHLW